ncbi:hypothetical protein NDU88_000330 [Pleurodeles waltl]|uniref:Uncharacterized protein n=1 Tax=Pleurodeles waltl TaxID=8319 RepID=A0AAV7P2I1_PLEWA|nr:hypothetical protein NDU88_000330 [Pleurodeles waltl]
MGGSQRLTGTCTSSGGRRRQDAETPQASGREVIYCDRSGNKPAAPRAGPRRQQQAGECLLRNPDLLQCGLPVLRARDARDGFTTAPRVPLSWGLPVLRARDASDGFTTAPRVPLSCGLPCAPGQGRTVTASLQRLECR